MTREERIRQEREADRVEKLRANLDRRDRAIKFEPTPETKITADLLRAAGRKGKGDDKS